MLSVSLKIGFLVLSILLMGLPLNNLLDLFCLTFLLLILGTSKFVAARKKNVLISFGILAFAIGLKSFLPSLRIEEGHNLFLYDQEQPSVFQTQLPSPVFNIMKNEFETYYPQNWNSKKTCSRINLLPEQAFAWSADGIFQSNKYSRVVSTINFNGINQLRLGAVNKGSYNYYGSNCDVDRKRLPYFTYYEFPDNAVGGTVSWKGKIIWIENGTHAVHESTEAQVKPITTAGTQLYGLGINSHEDLSLSFSPPLSLKIIEFFKQIIIFGSILIALYILRPAIRWSDIKIPFLSVLAGFITVLLYKNASLLLGLHPYDGGSDGLTYQGFGRIMTQNLLNGNYSEFLRGAESIFYFMPGQRYLNSLFFFLFGETNFGFVLAIFFFSILIYRLMKLLFPEKWSFYLFLAFAFVPMFWNMGFSLLLYVKEAFRGHAEIFGNGFFLYGLILLLSDVTQKTKRFNSTGFVAAFLFALSIILRPQLCVPVFVLFLFMFWKIAVQERSYKDFVVMSFGFLPILLLPLHNVYFGQKFVPLTSAAYIPENLWTPPTIYLQSFIELLTFHWNGDAIKQVISHLTKWNSVFEIYRLIPFTTMIYVVFRRTSDYWIRAIAASGLSMNMLLFFYIPTGRYSVLAWMMCFIVFMIVVQREILPALQRKREAFRPL